MSVFRRFCLLPRRIRRQHLSEQSIRSQRPSRAIPFIHKHSARPAHLRPDSMGHGTLEDPRNRERLLELHVGI